MRKLRCRCLVRRWTGGRGFADPRVWRRDRQHQATGPGLVMVVRIGSHAGAVVVDPRCVLCGGVGVGDVDPDPVSFLEHPGGRQDLDREFCDLSRDEWLGLLVRVPRALRRGTGGVCVAVGRTEPAAGDDWCPGCLRSGGDVSRRRRLVDDADDELGVGLIGACVQVEDEASADFQVGFQGLSDPAALVRQVLRRPARADGGIAEARPARPVVCGIAVEGGVFGGRGRLPAQSAVVQRGRGAGWPDVRYSGRMVVPGRGQSRAAR